MTLIQVQFEIKFDACYEFAEDTDDRGDSFYHQGFCFCLWFFPRCVDIVDKKAIDKAIACVTSQKKENDKDARVK